MVATFPRAMAAIQAGMNFFSGKVIFIFSPQPWHYLQLSKHHYARALAKFGLVHFVCPPQFSWWPRVEVSQEMSGLMVVQPKVMLPAVVRVRCRRFYKRLYPLLFQWLSARLPQPDVAVDFGCHSLFQSLNFLKRPVKIYFPVDDFANLDSDRRGAKFVFTVSSAIWKKFGKDSCVLLNHGLSDDFAKLAREERPWRGTGKLRVGCSGNLFIRFLDRDVLRRIVLEHPGVEFHFFGSMTLDPNEPWHIDWDNFLRSTPNVVLHGVLSSKQLVSEYVNMDAFILAYRPDYVNYHGENSHKVLEYLSSGRVVISTFLSNYENSHYLQMAPRDQNQVLVELFRSVLKDIDRWNSPSAAQARRAFALENTYDRHVSYISEVISNVG